MIASIIVALGITVYRCGSLYQDFLCPGAVVVDLTWTPATAEDRFNAEMLRFGSPLYLPSYGGGGVANIGPRSAWDRYFELAPRHYRGRR